MGENIDLTTEELRLYRQHRARLGVKRARTGCVVGIFVCLVSAGVFTRAFSEVPFWRLGGLGIIGAAVLGFGLATLFHRRAERFLPVIVWGVETTLAFLIGAGAAHTGGYRSPVCFLVLLSWFAAAAVAGAPLSTLVAVIVSQMTVVFTIIATQVPEPGSAWGVAAILTSAAAYCIAGSVLREKNASELFAANLRLDDIKRTLQERVDVQVGEIVAQAEAVKKLDKQLRVRVQERSRALAKSLQRLSRSTAAVPGEVIGKRVRILRALRAGGMGTVYLGDDLITRMPVAIKLISPQAISDANAIQRFLVEAAAAAAVPHPGIVRTLHVDVADDGRLYQVMEYVDGVTLGRCLGDGQFTSAEAARVVGEVARTVSAAHAAGVIHRDIKPNNIMLSTGRPAVRLLDFGLSKFVGSDVDSALTRSEQILGTPKFMSPEQVDSAGTVTASTDVYSIGLVLFEVVAGHSPYSASTPAQYLNAHITERPQELTGDPELGRIIAACLSKRPDARPAAATLGDQLTELADRRRCPPVEEIAKARLTVRTHVRGDDSTISERRS